MELLIGNKIRELRKSMHMTQEQLADAAGVSFQAVSKWENCIALPDITLVPLLANIFKVTIDELFDYSNAEMQKEIEKNVLHVIRGA